MNVCCGWILSDYDVWEKCPIHYRGQVDPENGMAADEEKERWEALSQEERDSVKEACFMRNTQRIISEMKSIARAITEEVPF